MLRRVMQAGITLMALLVVYPPTSLLAREGSPEKFKPRRYQEAYREILADYAKGESQKALEDLFSLEADLVTTHGPALIPKLLQSKTRVARNLSANRPAVLLPIASLHLDAYLLYLANRQSDLAVHSRLFTVELAELLGSRVRDDEATSRASRVLTSLAAYLQRAFMESTAAQLFERALTLDPDNAAALLGLAALRERHGEYDRALPHLDRLLAVEPENPEGRLRRAITLSRLDRSEEAKSAFERLVNSPAPDWILTVGYQEWARSLASDGRYEDARTVIEIAIERLPQDATLPIQAAYLADRQIPATTERALAQALTSRAASPTRSPRYIYSQIPRRSIDEMRSILVAETNQELPGLRLVLGDRRQSGTGSSLP